MFIIHVAETGQSFELVEEYHQESRVDEIQELLAVLTHVAKQDQLLFSGNARLEPQRALGSYGLPSSARPVFLFNRQRLSPDAHPPKPEELGKECVVAPPKSLPPARRYSDLDPAIRSLPSCEQQFKHHLDRGNAFLSASEAKVEACKKLVMEMRVQEMALDAVRANTEQHLRSIDNTYREFAADFRLLSQQHTEILASFGKDLNKLRACVLHPALQTQGRRTLLDCVDEACLRRSADECAAFHKQLCSKVSTFNCDYMQFKKETEEFLSEAPSSDHSRLEVLLSERSGLLEEESSIVQCLSKNATLVTHVLDVCSQGQDIHVKRVQDLLSGLGPMYDLQQRSHLPRMENCDAELGKLLEMCLGGKNAMNTRVHSSMQKVAVLQRVMRDTRDHVSAFREAMTRQEENFDALRQARRTGNSYKACLAEVARRRAYMKLYMGHAGQLAERLARKREREVARREQFAQAHSVNLPRDLLHLMGLNQAPSQCLVDIAPFDTDLLDVDVSQVEQLAPQYLVASLVDTGEDWSIGEADKYCLDEVAGTSRLEVENARLKAQLASSIAVICSIDADLLPECLGDLEDQEVKLAGSTGNTAQALRLKDEHAKHLQKVVEAKQAQCDAYEQRIRELESRLREQSLSMSRDMNAGVLSETSGVTVEVESRAVSDPMDGVTSNEPAAVQDSKQQLVLQHPTCPSPSSSLIKEKLSLTEDQTKCLLREIFRLTEQSKQQQMNAADLEKRLQEAICTAERKGSLYTEFRASTAKLCGVIKSLELVVVSSTGGLAGFVKSLRDVSERLSSEAGDAVGIELVKTFVDKVAALAREQAEQDAQLRKELETKAEVIKSLFAKCKMEKQASREKVTLARFQVHELALFVRDAAGRYEALNRGCSNYFLSDESVALFCERAGASNGAQQQPPAFILGQIVHIEHHIARDDDEDTTTTRPRYNPYLLPSGTPFFVVTVAMVPGLHSQVTT